MNKRQFFKTLAIAAAGFTILPAATSYDRIWRVQKSIGRELYPLEINPDWETAEYEIRFQTYKEVIIIPDFALPRYKLVNGTHVKVYKWRLKEV